jgi:hypothetical protein
LIISVHNSFLPFSDLNSKSVKQIKGEEQELRVLEKKTLKRKYILELRRKMQEETGEHSVTRKNLYPSQYVIKVT